MAPHLNTKRIDTKGWFLKNQSADAARYDKKPCWEEKPDLAHGGAVLGAIVGIMDEPWVLRQ